ncbi:MAG: carboxymuconolactone decarboxylase family protein [Burkholderiales bacterium]|jgi:alkylhydroperoxidase family enzyme|nr:carboxymuconolactone decarboxylase family protein [Burkholderiales bacterium]
MSHLPLLPAVPMQPPLSDILADLRTKAGADFEFPNLYRVMGHAPEMLRAWVAFAWPLRLAATTPRSLRELLILRGAQVCNAKFEWAHHVPMAFSAGVSRTQIDALEHWRDADCFDAQQRAALRVAEEISIGPAASPEAIAELRACGFTDGEVVELTLTASFYVCVARFLGSMDMPLEPDYEKYCDNGLCRLPAV